MVVMFMHVLRLQIQFCHIPDQRGAARSRTLGISLDGAMARLSCQPVAGCPALSLIRRVSCLAGGWICILRLGWILI